MAQNSNEKFTLGQCLDFAINNSYAAHRANLDVSEAGYQINEARSNVLPQINASGGFDHSLVLPTTMLPGELIGESGMQIPVQMGSKNELDFGVSVEQIIFSPTLFTGIKIAKNNQELQSLRAAMTREEVIFDVSNAFYDILNSMQELENIHYMVSMQDSLYRLMEKRVEENVTREVDLNRIKVNLTNLRARGKNMGNVILQQKRYLQILIGIPIEDAFDVDDSEVQNIGLSELRGYSQPQNRIELDVLNKQKEMLELEIHSHKMEYMPTLSAIASAGYQFQSNRLNLTRDPWYSSAVVGVRLSIPIFDGFGKRNRIRQKQTQLQGLDWDIRETQQTLSANYLNAKNQMEVIYELVQVQSENLKLAEKVYSQTMALYTEGLASITDLLETETSLHEVKIAYTTELIRYKKTEIDLLKASGTLKYLLSNN
ncbi:TolC family protein [Bacteroides reticulotermitis]|uniref:Outer membrane efflux protein n=2 Tax=Bacteroides reticulotermitis TaxID=1133319 RepID=W4V030_9BACE|nr:TolC family protein [Bacteroides reticulotermitis]GAE86576.1 outer membrane efflux protein [Bacteroides reticulotermitis JCM 10512]